MFGTYFYHQTSRKMVVAFGTLFNNIELKKTVDGQVLETEKVPLAYGPKQKFLYRLQGNPTDGRKVAITLPRLYFEMSSIEYDGSRKTTALQKYRTVIDDNGTEVTTQYVPVPYNIGFELGVIAKSQDAGLQILEQILPFFQPDYTITINDMADMGIKRDVPIILSSVSYEDSYQGNFEERRAIMYTLAFTAKFYLYGPVTSDKVIKTVQVDQFTDAKVNAPTREQRYTVTPDPVSADADDDFGFNETVSFFQDAKERDLTTGTDKTST